MLNTKKITKIKEEFEKNYKNISQRVVICGDTGCASSGSFKVYDAFKEQMAARNLNFCPEITSSCHENSTYVMKSGCQGFCSQGPLVEVNGILYTKVKPEDVSEIIDKTILKGEIVDRLLYLNPKDNQRCKDKTEIPFYKKQHRILLGDCGRLNPADFGEYVASGGFQGLIKAFQNGPEWTINEMKAAYDELTAVQNKIDRGQWGGTTDGLNRITADRTAKMRIVKQKLEELRTIAASSSLFNDKLTPAQKEADANLAQKYSEYKVRVDQKYWFEIATMK